MTIQRLLDIVFLGWIDRVAIWWLERRTRKFTVEIKPLINVLRQTARPDDNEATASELMLDAYQRALRRRIE